MMSKHTPGPWKIFRDPRPDMEWNNHIGTLIDGKEFDVCFMTHDGTKANFEGEANAKLIAAAPKLLDALKKALEQTEDGLHQSPCDEPDCWVEFAEAAIAEAEEEK